jgi:hypothetical protein
MDFRRKLFTCFVCLIAVALGATAQTLTTGEVTGTITDQSGGVLSKAPVTLKNNATGSTQNTQTNSDGLYRFSFVAPGPYTISTSPQGFQEAKRVTQIGVGQSSTVDIQLALASASTTVEVSEAAVAVQTDNANLTTNVNLQQVANLPNSGNDLTFYALTSPGVTMSTNGGYGNFQAFGLPATSNVFTINGQVNNDSFLNLNNSGASNLMLGFNEIQEVAVVNNGYTGQYGGLAGTQMNFVSKSGTNKFHGDAIYYWNGRTMNANNFFNNASDTPRPFSNVNMWATSAGGPIKKDKTFFFVDYEGLRIVLPSNILTRTPSPQYSTATLTNLASTGQTAAIPFYQNIFKLYAGANGAANSTPVANGGCGSFTGLGAGVPCALQFRSTAGNFTKEYVWSARVDHNISDNDRLYGRFQRDNGTQPTYTDPINPIFNSFSPQPEWNTQLSENHTFSATAINQFIASAQYYSARFGPSDPAAVLAVFPTTLQFTGSSFYGMGNFTYRVPQGRNVTQYQFIDDLSKSLGNHNVKVGVNFHRIDLSDFNFTQYVNGRITTSLASFFAGGGTGSNLTQRFPVATSQPLAYYNLGVYVQDQWKIGSHLTLTPTLRIDHNSNPVCQHDCFARLNTSFDSLVHDPNVPYNQIIQTGLHQAFPSTDRILWEPRMGFAYAPTKSGNTVFRGGFGIFGDTYPGTAAEPFARNAPALNSFTVTNGAITPGTANSLFNIASAANQAFINGFNSGGTLASIKASNPFFVPPNYTTTAKYHQARYLEWNFELQQALGWKTVLSVNYVGNHGYHELLQNGGLNAYDPGFVGLPAVAPDSRFGIINQYDTGALSNYNGLVVGVQRRFSSGFSFGANYTYSHARDMVSNAGFEAFDLNTNASVLGPQNPYNTRLYNYGNSDYDVRHYASVNYVWDNVFRHVGKGAASWILGGWTISGTLFTRSGQPFTVVDNSATGTLNAKNYNGIPGTGPMFVFATPLQGGYTSCSSSAVDTPCLSANQFTAATTAPTGFGNQLRNQYRGPMYFDTDLAVMKGFPLGKWESARFLVGFQFFNLFNHPNFDKPVGDVSDPNFGSVINLVSPPTSILGSFVGADASGRIIQLKAQIVF